MEQGKQKSHLMMFHPLGSVANRNKQRLCLNAISLCDSEDQDTAITVWMEFIKTLMLDKEKISQ